MKTKSSLSNLNLVKNFLLLFFFYFIVSSNISFARSISPFPQEIASMTQYRENTGAVYYFYITGNNSGNLWGSGIYTDDSSVAAAAVHMGLLADGEKGVIKVSILPGQTSYTSSSTNGVTSSAYGSWTGSFSVAADDGGDNPVLADPGKLTQFRTVPGGVYQFNVTASDSGGLWGSNVYSDDTQLARAVVHSGILQDGQTGVVRVVISAGLDNYISSTANGLTSSSYSSEWPSSYSVSNTTGSIPLIAYPGSYQNPLANPGSLTQYRESNGGAIYFNVTGSDSGGLWGSNPYTDDSSLAIAAVHAGILAVGQTGIVKVNIEEGGSSYPGSLANGINATNYSSSWPSSYSITVADGAVGLIPVIYSELSKNLTVGEQFNYQIQTTNSPTYYQATGLPESLTMSSSGYITGSSKISGIFPVELLVSNSSGSSTKTLLLTISQNGDTSNTTSGSGNTSSGSDNTASDPGNTNSDLGNTGIAGTLAENFDIALPYLDYTSLLGTQSLWVKFSYAGKNSSNELIWKLVDIGVNASNSPSGAATVSENLDIYMPSINYQTSLGDFNIWINFEYAGQDTDGLYLWKLKNYGVN